MTVNSIPFWVMVPFNIPTNKWDERMIYFKSSMNPKFNHIIVINFFVGHFIKHILKFGFYLWG